MRIMYDSVTARNIPRNAAMVAGYLDGKYRWSEHDWELFPHAVHVGIVINSKNNDGQVLDVEAGNARPIEAPGWIKMRRAAGCEPTIYCSAHVWPAVEAACARAGIRPPQYWIASWGRAHGIPAGAVALQYEALGPYDVSMVHDHWPGVDPPLREPDGGLREAPGVDLVAARAAVADLVHIAKRMQDIFFAK